jgi:hypothetical protein
MGQLRIPRTNSAGSGVVDGGLRGIRGAFLGRLLTREVKSNGIVVLCAGVAF